MVRGVIVKLLHMHGNDFLAAIVSVIISVYNITLGQWNLVVGIAVGVLMVVWYGWKLIDKIKDKCK